jgi:hypothetical protein
VTAHVEPRTVNPPYTYRANIISVHDGDTLHLDVDLGFHLTVDLPVLFRSLGPDKYGGRWLGVLTLPDGRDVATQMIRDRYAAPWDGKGTKPVPPWPIPI